MYRRLLIITAFKSIMNFKHRHRELVFKALVREMLSCCLLLSHVVVRCSENLTQATTDHGGCDE